MLRDRAATALDALQRIGVGVTLRGVQVAEALQPDMQARRVHHHEHRRQPSVRLADQPARCTVEGHCAGGAALDPHLLLDAVAADRVASPIGQDLGREEQGDSLRSRRRVGHPRQHQVDDVVGQVVLTAGDEDLVAGQREAAVRARLGAGAQQGQVTAGLRFGQVHRRQPLATRDPAEVPLLQDLAAMGAQALVGAVQQPGIHRPAVVRRGDHLVEGRVEQRRKPLAAVFRTARQRRPAACDVRRIGVAVAAGRAHHAVLPGAAFEIRRPVDRCEHAGRELASLFEHLARGLGVEVGEVGHLAP